MDIPPSANAISHLIERLTPDCGKATAQQIEHDIHDVAREFPELLLLYARHEQPCVREALSVVAGRLYRPDSDDAGLRELLDTLASDSDKWVRIKAQRALTGGLADAEQMSPLANCCISLHSAVRADKTQQELRRLADAIEGAFRRKVMRRRARRKGPLNLTSDGILHNDPDDLLRFLAIAAGAPSELWDNDIDLSPGWKGDELRLLSARRFSPLIASFAIWPQRLNAVYVASVWCHEDWPDDFALWHQRYNTPRDAKLAIDSLPAEQDYRTSPGGDWQEIVHWV